MKSHCLIMRKQSLFPPPKEIKLISYESMTHTSDIKLIEQELRVRLCSSLKSWEDEKTATLPHHRSTSIK